MDGTIILATPRARTVIGYDMAELKGMSIFDLILPDCVDQFRESLFGMMRNLRVIERLETVMRDKNGRLVYVDISGVSIRLNDEPIYQFTIRDVSDRVVRAQIEMKRARDEAELYLDLIAHDIANLNQIGMGYIELALETLPLDDRGREMLEKPLDVFRNTSRLISNVKKLRTAHHGEGWKIERVSMAKLITSLNEEFQSDPQRQITINYQIKKDCMVMANGLIREIFVNLLGNAIKHSREGMPLNVNVILDRIRLDSQDYCQIAVEDDGPGIQDDQKKKLMARIAQPAGSNRTGGIGLILTRTLIEDFGGKLLIEDRVPGDSSKGARFVVLLPMAPPSGDLAAAPS